jgi:catechol 2,3-dioxygenase-like lactoylglutathione lyase family enzyme
MKTGHIEIFVKDPVVSKNFYSDILEFELVEIQHNSFVWMKSGDILVLLRPGTGLKSEINVFASTNVGLVLYTGNLEKKADKMRNKGLKFKGTDGSEKCLTFTDPDGNWFQLVNPNEH